MGANFDSARVALGTGEHLAALFLLVTVKLTSFFVVAGSFMLAEAGTETTRLEGITPIRELPIGGSLLRMVSFDCSIGFMHTPERGGGLKMASEDTVSVGDVEGLSPSVGDFRAGSTRVTTGGLLLSPRGAGRESGINELGLTEEGTS